MGETAKGQREWRLDLLNSAFLTGTPVLAIVGLIWYSITVGISWVEPIIFIGMYLASGLSITAGYHRLFSHRTHKAAWPLRLFYALFGAAAFQNSAIKWCSDHRRHHSKTDTGEDPYSVTHGFFWAHMGWVMVDEGDDNIEKVEDLQNDPILAWQERNIFKIGFVIGILFPAFLGYLFIGGWAGFFGGMIWGGFLRLVLVHHGTFLINSAAHVWGSQPYSKENTSKDSPVLSLFTFGEGYHNFHHTFQADYRNGHKWHHWDPSKWWIKSFSLIKMTSELHKIPKRTIESQRMKTKFEEIRSELEGQDLDVYNESFIECFKRYRAGFKELSARRAEYKETKRSMRKEAWLEKKEQLKANVKECKARLAEIRKEFNDIFASMKNATPA